MSTLLGARVGHFRFVDLIGKGGMGEVYVGYDETLGRKVALKTIRAQHRLDAAAKARFLREARILSQLRHPNICQIHDYIEGDDADVLVLELIHGQSLGHARTRGLSHRQKLEIALQVTRVLVAAHEAGIVHRDLKPDNVMLDEHDQVKVLDFGLSRSHMDEQTLALSAHDTGALDEPAVDGHTLKVAGPDPSGKLTVAGQIMGTLGYMSPEQARGEAATPASDMYSLGLLLQELFTGRPPFEPQEPFPGLLAKAQAGESLPIEGVDADVMALVNRLKSATPAVRPSAVDTAERIQWILGKPARRTKRYLAIAAIAVLTSLSAFLAVQTVRAKRAGEAAQAARAAAEREARASRMVSEFLVSMFKESDPYSSGRSGSAVTARELLDRGVKKIDQELAGQPEIRARLLNTMGRAFTSLADYGKAEPLLKEGLRIREEVLPADDPQVADSLTNLALLYGDLGRHADAEPLLERALQIREQALGPHHADVAGALNNLALLHEAQGQYVAAEPLLQRTLEIYEAAYGPEHPDVADTLNALGMLYWDQGRFSDAEPTCQRALRIFEKTLGPDHPTTANPLNNLALLTWDQGRLAEAEPLLRRTLQIREKALGPNHPNTADAITNLGALYDDLGRHADAEPLCRRALEIYQTALGPKHQRVALASSNLGYSVGRLGRFAEAAALFERAIRVYKEALDPDHPLLAEAYFFYGEIRAREGKRRASLALLEQALRISVDRPCMASIRERYAPLEGDPELERLAARIEKAQASR